MKFRENVERSILLVGAITQECLGDFIPVLLNLDRVRHKDGIHIYLTSPGGAATAGLTIYDLLKARKNDVTIIASGECSSVAALILQAATYRLVSPHTRMLLHFGQADMSDKGSVDGETLRRAGDEMGRLDATFLDILCERSTMQRAVMARTLQANTYLNTDDIIHAGLADEVTYTPTYKRQP